jgi:5S rRNA maturation endonuclease (ribonuclease M5)/KaiC/GvpD/RAD55 family RecA-like ATPase
MSDVISFYAALGITLPEWSGEEARIACLFPDRHSHGDRNKSASVERATGRWYCGRCQEGGGLKDAARARGRSDDEATELLRRCGFNTAPQITDAYDYVDAGGRMLFQVVRRDDKSFRQRRPDGMGGWVWNLKGVDRVLYRLPQVANAVGQLEPVWVVEGEKDVHALERVGITATTNPMGAEKWRSEYSEALRGAQVVVCGDCDQVGRESSRAIAKALEGTAKAVKVLDLEPARSDGYDVADFLSAARSEDGRADARCVLTRWVKSIPLFAPAAPAERVPSANTPSTAGTLAPSLKLHKLDVAKMAREDPPEIPWRVEGVLADGVVTMIFSPPGEGKSLLAASFAAALAAGESIAGLGTRKGRVVYIDAENGAWEIHRRIKALGLPPDGVAVYEAREDFDLRKDGEEVKRILDVERANVLILDSLRSLAPGLDENDSLQCEAALAPIRRYAHDQGVAVGLIHHANKGGRTYRGSSAISAAVDVSYRLGRADGDPDRQRRFLEADKMRIGPEPERRWLRIGVEHGMVLVGEAEPYEGDTNDAPKAPAQETLTPAVIAALSGGRMNLAAICRTVGRSPKDGTVRRVVEKVATKDDEGFFRLKEGVPSAMAPIEVGTLAPSENGHDPSANIAEWQRLKGMGR